MKKVATSIYFVSLAGVLQAFLSNFDWANDFGHMSDARLVRNHDLGFVCSTFPQTEKIAKECHSSMVRLTAALQNIGITCGLTVVQNISSPARSPKCSVVFVLPRLIVHHCGHYGRWVIPLISRQELSTYLSSVLQNSFEMFLKADCVCASGPFAIILSEENPEQILQTCALDSWAPDFCHREDIFAPEKEAEPLLSGSESESELFASMSQLWSCGETLLMPPMLSFIV